MRILLAVFAAAAVWTARGQGTFEAIEDYDNATLTFWDGTAGETFTVTNPVTVTSLGCFNYLFGLNPGTIQVGLWDSSGALLASDIIAANSPLLNQSRYLGITPVFLAPNQTYLMGAYSTNGTIYMDATYPALGGSVATAPEIVLGEPAQLEGFFGPPTPVSGAGGTLYLGPNFQFQDGVPEPSSGLLLGLAALLLLACWKWQARAPNAP